MQPLPLHALQSKETTPDKDEFIQGFGDVMIDSAVNRGGEKILKDDNGDFVDDNVSSMTEELTGADFGYIGCPSTVYGVQNGTHIMYLFINVWERDTIQPKTRCNAMKNRQLKDFLSPHLVQYIYNGI